jgi:hypothetical protein
MMDPCIDFLRESDAHLIRTLTLDYILFTEDVVNANAIPLSLSNGAISFVATQMIR